ncbi:MAG TPA: class I SAM-dependent methyltransferase [Isosphaeraceae bacterium]|jgi:ubiquinone/menaquinone biosynthesis C-methylase UbiE|nr:class I SAM-dependent methyltransferase [Isosphaeraceae bacterium]
MPRPEQAEYDRLAPSYDSRWASYNAAAASATLDGLDLQPGLRVLDLAAGTGLLARHALRRQPALSVLGIDLSRGMLALGHGPRVQADAARLPLADAAFDLVLSASAFHVFPRPSAPLAEARRVLRPGGTLVLTDWCDDYLTCKLLTLWLRLTSPSPPRPQTLRSCRLLLEAAGFSVVSARRFKVDWSWGLMRLEARR